MFLPPQTKNEGHGHCQLFQAATRHTVDRETSPLVYANLLFVLIQVADPPAAHPEALEIPQFYLSFRYPIETSNSTWL